MESTAKAAPRTHDAWLFGASGDASGFPLPSLFGDLFPLPFVWVQYAVAGEFYAQAARDYVVRYGQERDNLGWVGSAFAWHGGRMADGRPAAPDENAYSCVRTSSVELLHFGGALETLTPPQEAMDALLAHLPNGRQVVLPGFGRTARFLAEPPSSRLPGSIPRIGACAGQPGSSWRSVAPSSAAGVDSTPRMMRSPCSPRSPRRPRPRTSRTSASIPHGLEAPDGGRGAAAGAGG
ncbi:MAG: hypothetical protein U0531_21205 [Dehalococcoidia bacterium]